MHGTSNSSQDTKEPRGRLCRSFRVTTPTAPEADRHSLLLFEYICSYGSEGYLHGSETLICLEFGCRSKDGSRLDGDGTRAAKIKKTRSIHSGFFGFFSVHVSSRLASSHSRHVSSSWLDSLRDGNSASLCWYPSTDGSQHPAIVQQCM